MQGRPKPNQTDTQKHALLHVRTIFAAQVGQGLGKASGETKVKAGLARFTPAAITLRRARGTVLGKGQTWVTVVTIGACRVRI
jgi:C4-dicarboxylate transporter